MIQLRPYQTEAVDALFNYWAAPDSSHGLIVLPTGTGKSLVIASIIKRIHDSWPDTRILILSHVKELLSQNHNEIISHIPDCNIGIFSAGLGKKDLHQTVIVAGIQSIEKRVHQMDPAPEIVIVDECHLIPRNESTRYKKALKTLEQMYPSLRVIGLTATAFRLDSGWLHHGDDAIFDRIVYEYPIQKAIDQGFLSHVTTRLPKIQLDADGVRKSGREFVAGELEAHILKMNKTPQAVADLIEKGKDRKKWLVFACGIKHAEEINTILIEAGISSAVLTGDTKKNDRDDLIESFKGNSLTPLQCLVNVSVLTTGFNAPQVDLIAMMRPTESCGLYVQIVGRGTRICPGKKDCLVLDYAGNILRHGPIDTVNPDAKPWSEGDGIAPAKECPGCLSIIHAAKRSCPFCGYEFPPTEYQIQTRAIQSPILSQDIEPVELEIKHTEYEVHTKAGKKNSIRVTYYYGEFGKVSEWIFPEAHWQMGEFQYRKFCIAIGMASIPETAEEFMDLLQPGQGQAVKIVTKTEGKFDRVIHRVFGEKKAVEYQDEVPF